MTEAERIAESEAVFLARIMRVVESNEVPGMEPWNVENAADLLRRMNAADAEITELRRLAEDCRVSNDLIGIRVRNGMTALNQQHPSDTSGTK